MNDDGMLNAETQRKLPQGEILQPKLRFKGFTDPWQQRKLGELLQVRNGASQKQVEVADGKYPILATGGEIGRTNTPIYCRESVLIGRKGTIDKPVYMNTPFWTVDTLFYTELADEVNGRFVYAMFQTIPWKRFDTSTGVPSLTSSTIHAIKKFTPVKLTEQIRIGEFFRVLDDLIAAAKKKADLLKLRKRYYLQAIFSQQSRFKGFTGPWQQRKLGELFKERSERSNQGELISVTITNGVVPASSLERKDNSSEDKSNYKQVKTGDIAYNTMRMWQGASGVSPYSGILSPAYTVLIPSAEVSSSFFAQMFKLVRMLHLFQRYSQGLTSDTWNLKYPLLSEIRVTIPSLAEQERISEFLVLNDELTALVKKKAEDLQKIKSYYLQQLFV